MKTRLIWTQFARCVFITSRWNV